MAANNPVMLQLAPLPRTQIGPFLILGVDKDADKETVESQWAQRLIWRARARRVRRWRTSTGRARP